MGGDFEPPPDYETLKGPRVKGAREVLRFLLSREGGKARFSEIMRALSVKKQTLEHRLSILNKCGLIEREPRGPISVKFKTPLCFVCDTPGIPYAYLGLLGMREGRAEAETETAVALLEEELKAKFELVTVLTTREATGSWSESMPKALEERTETLHLSKEAMGDILSVEDRIRPKVSKLARGHKLIMDCTSGMRPAGIAYYRLAMEYKIPLVYVYEDERKLFWLISKRELKEEFKRILEEG